MKDIKYCLKIALLPILLLTSASIFATEPDWQKQNADLAAQEAKTANVKANTDAQISNTTAQKADTAARNANTNAQISNTSAQNAESAAKNANTDAQMSDTAAQKANTMRKILTPVPAPKEKNNVPSGFISCFFVEAGWFNGVWIPKHRACKYKSSPQGVEWVEGYWKCIKQQPVDNMTGMCITWEWQPGHWLKTLQEY